MGIQSLGVGSGLALDDLVSNLIKAEREPREKRLKKREESTDAVISGLGSIKSKMSELKKSVDDLKSNLSASARLPKIEFPTALKEGQTGAFTAEASNSAIAGEYQVAVTQLAKGTTYKTADTDFASSTDVVSNAAGSVTFNFSSSSDSFNVNVSSGMTLSQYVSAINSAQGNQTSDKSGPLVVATLINTGTSAGPKVVFESKLTGVGNDLRIINNDDIPGLSRLTSETSTGSNNALNTNTGSNAKVNAVNAIATIDGIQVQSASNKFENTIPNVSITVNQLSETNTDGITFKPAKLTIGNNTEDFKKKIKAFAENFNKFQDELSKQTRLGASALEDDGALAGDFMVRSLESGLNGILLSNNNSNPLGNIFQVGYGLGEKGKLEFSTIGVGTTGAGEKRLDDVLKNNFDDVISLFSDSQNGIAKKLSDYIDQYTRTGGLLTTRERSVKDEKELLTKERESFELQMLQFESIQRSKFIALDKTVASLNRTGSALLASLGSAPRRR